MEENMAKKINKYILFYNSLSREEQNVLDSFKKIYSVGTFKTSISIFSF